MKTVNEIGQEHGVHPLQVGQWKKEILEYAGTLCETKRRRKPADDQSAPERLYSEIGRLKVDTGLVCCELPIDTRRARFSGTRH